MTRINCGIDASELCDAHLLAEYRELPRLWRFKPVSKAPAHFTLNKGHVLWCAQYPRTFAERFESLVIELEHRGFKPQYRSAPLEALRSTLRAPKIELEHARPILQARILERLANMRPRWTARERPNWTLEKKSF